MYTRTWSLHIPIHIVCVQHDSMGNLKFIIGLILTEPNTRNFPGRFLLFRIFIQIPRREKKNCFLYCGQALFLLVMLECDKKRNFHFYFKENSFLYSFFFCYLSFVCIIVRFIYIKTSVFFFSLNIRLLRTRTRVSS